MNDYILEKLKTPALGLIVTAIFNLVLGFMGLFSGALAFLSTKNQAIPTDPAEKAGYLIGYYSPYVWSISSIIFAPLIFFGAFRMMKGKNRGLAFLAAILGLIPCSSCCWIGGAIFGIWAIVILIKPEVKEFFKSGGPTNYYPPQPPSY